MNNPKISVIIPVYNAEKYLAECLDTVLNQTFKDIEVICINDGSTDNSLKILKEYALKDDRIKIISISNKGCGYARRIALKETNGEYILFCDSDDKYLNNDVFYELYKKIKNTSVDLLLFDYYFITDKQEYIKYPVPEKEIFTYKDFINFYNLPIAPWMKFYKKTFLDKYYNDWYLPQENVTSGDTPFHFQIFIRANSISYLDKPLYLHYRREDSLQTKRVTEKKLQEYCVHVQAINDVVNKECEVIEIKRDIIYFFFYSFYWRLQKYYLIQSILSYKTIELIRNTCEEIRKTVKDIDLSYYLHCNDLAYRKALFFYKISLRLSIDKLQEYFNKKYVKEINQKQKKLIKSKNIEIQNLRTQINIKDQAIKRLQNSWSYKIGRLFTYPLSIPIDFYRFIRDYNLIKKSGLFDSEYYLTQNEDVKNAKMNPIKHYLKFGWKEGRNPSSEFDGNEYLNKRPDVRVAGVCPLVHYIKFGEK